MFRPLLASLLALALTACASVQKLDAANDVHALLLSIRDSDQATFDAHVDREALKSELMGRLNIEAIKDKQLGALAQLLGPAVIDFAGDTLIQPQVFKTVAAQYGYGSDTKIPNSMAISTLLRTMPDGRVCAPHKKDGPCMLIFTKQEGVWRLTGFEGDVSMLRLQL